MSEQKQYDVPEVLAALKAAVEKRGADYVYDRPVNECGATQCLYVHGRSTENPTPGCLVGQVYYDLTGQLVPAKLEVGLSEGDDPSDWLTHGPFTEAALRVLDAAQTCQDELNPWGEALAAAIEAAEE